MEAVLLRGELLLVLMLPSLDEQVAVAPHARGGGVEVGKKLMNRAVEGLAVSVAASGSDRSNVVHVNYLLKMRLCVTTNRCVNVFIGNAFSIEKCIVT